MDRLRNYYSQVAAEERRRLSEGFRRASSNGRSTGKRKSSSFSMSMGSSSSSSDDAFDDDGEDAYDEDSIAGGRDDRLDLSGRTTLTVQSNTAQHDKYRRNSASDKAVSASPRVVRVVHNTPPPLSPTSAPYGQNNRLNADGSRPHDDDDDGTSFADDHRHQHNNGDDDDDRREGSDTRDVYTIIASERRRRRRQQHGRSLPSAPDLSGRHNEESGSNTENEEVLHIEISPKRKRLPPRPPPPDNDDEEDGSAAEEALALAVERVKLLTLEKESITRQLKAAHNDKINLIQKHDAEVGSVLVRADEAERGLKAHIQHLEEAVALKESHIHHLTAQHEQSMREHAETAADAYQLVHASRHAAEAAVENAKQIHDIVAAEAMRRVDVYSSEVGLWVGKWCGASIETAFWAESVLGWADGTAENDSSFSRRSKTNSPRLNRSPTRRDNLGRDLSSSSHTAQQQRSMIVTSPHRSNAERFDAGPLTASPIPFLHQRQRLIVSFFNERETLFEAFKSLAEAQTLQEQQAMHTDTVFTSFIDATESEGRGLLCSAFVEGLSTMKALFEDGLVALHDSMRTSHSEQLQTVQLDAKAALAAMEREHACVQQALVSSTIGMTNLAEAEERARQGILLDSVSDVFLNTMASYWHRVAADSSTRLSHLQQTCVLQLDEKQATIDALRERITVLSVPIPLPPPPPPPQMPEGAVTREELERLLAAQRAELKNDYNAQLNEVNRKHQEASQRWYNEVDALRRDTEARLGERDLAIRTLEKELESQKKAHEEATAVREAYYSKSYSDLLHYTSQEMVKLESFMRRDVLESVLLSTHEVMLQKAFAGTIHATRAAEHFRQEALLSQHAMTRLREECAERINSMENEHRERVAASRFEIDAQLSDMHSLHESEVDAAVKEIARLREALREQSESLTDTQKKLIAAEEGVVIAKGRVMAVEREMSVLQEEAKRTAHQHRNALAAEKETTHGLLKAMEAQCEAQMEALRRDVAAEADLLHANHAFELDRARHAAEESEQRCQLAEEESRRVIRKMREEHQEELSKLARLHDDQFAASEGEILRLRDQVASVERSIEAAVAEAVAEGEEELKRKLLEANAGYEAILEEYHQLQVAQHEQLQQQQRQIVPLTESIQSMAEQLASKSGATPTLTATTPTRRHSVATSPMMLVSVQKVPSSPSSSPHALRLRSQKGRLMSPSRAQISHIGDESDFSSSPLQLSIREKSESVANTSRRTAVAVGAVLSTSPQRGRRTATPPLSNERLLVETPPASTCSTAAIATVAAREELKETRAQLAQCLAVLHTFEGRVEALKKRYGQDDDEEKDGGGAAADGEGLLLGKSVFKRLDADEAAQQRILEEAKASSPRRQQQQHHSDGHQRRSTSFYHYHAQHEDGDVSLHRPIKQREKISSSSSAELSSSALFAVLSDAIKTAIREATSVSAKQFAATLGELSELIARREEGKEGNSNATTYVAPSSNETAATNSHSEASIVKGGVDASTVTQSVGGNNTNNNNKASPHQRHVVIGGYVSPLRRRYFHHYRYGSGGDGGDGGDTHNSSSFVVPSPTFSSPTQDPTAVFYWKARCNTLEKMLDSLQQQLAKRCEEIDSLNEDIVGRQAQLDDAKNTIKALERQIEAFRLDEKHKAAADDAKMLCQRCEQLKTTVAVMESTHQEKIRRLEMKIAAMTASGVGAGSGVAAPQPQEQRRDSQQNSPPHRRHHDVSGGATVLHMTADGFEHYASPPPPFVGRDNSVHRVVDPFDPQALKIQQQRRRAETPPSRRNSHRLHPTVGLEERPFPASPSLISRQPKVLVPPQEECHIEEEEYVLPSSALVGPSSPILMGGVGANINGSRSAPTSPYRMASIRHYVAEGGEGGGASTQNQQAAPLFSSAPSSHGLTTQHTTMGVPPLPSLPSLPHGTNALKEALLAERRKAQSERLAREVDETIATTAKVAAAAAGRLARSDSFAKAVGMLGSSSSQSSAAGGEGVSTITTSAELPSSSFALRNPHLQLLHHGAEQRTPQPNASAPPFPTAPTTTTLTDASFNNLFDARMNRNLPAAANAKGSTAAVAWGDAQHGSSGSRPSSAIRWGRSESPHAAGKAPPQQVGDGARGTRAYVSLAADGSEARNSTRHHAGDNNNTSSQLAFPISDTATRKYPEGFLRSVHQRN